MAVRYAIKANEHASQISPSNRIAQDDEVGPIMTGATHTILEFIGRFRPGYARTLRYEIAMMTEDEQEEHVMQALGAIRPTESELRVRQDAPREARPKLRVDRAAWAGPNIRLFDGCRILGRVIAWFPAPIEKK